MSSNNTYYVYAYLRNKDSKTAKAGTPYYIGKGSGRRAWVTHKHKTPVPKDKTFIVLLEQNLTEVGALALERRMIAWHGRKDLGTGILLNRTDGGDGCSGVIMSELTKEKRNAAQRGKKLSEEHKRKISVGSKSRPPISEETREKFRLRNKNRAPMTAEERVKLSIAVTQSWARRKLLKSSAA
jgi:hypothetical protein